MSASSGRRYDRRDNYLQNCYPLLFCAEIGVLLANDFAAISKLLGLRLRKEVREACQFLEDRGLKFWYVSIPISVRSAQAGPG